MMKIIMAACAGIAVALTLAFGAAVAQTQEETDALYVAQDWEAAAVGYEALLADDATNAQNWFNLGQSRHQLNDVEAAREAYHAALDNGFQPVPRARFHLARALMSLGDEESALQELETIAATGGPSSAALQATAEFAPLAEEPRFAAVLEALRPCATEQHRQFDFWLGEWDVTPPATPGATYQNSITSAQDGCVVFEQYTAGGFTGMSLNFYDSTTGKWHQTWMSNAGGSVYLEGGLDENGAMVLTDAELPISAVTGSVNRVTWTPLDDGRVRQHWESSTDGGETWSTAFDGYYARKPDAGGG